MEKLNYIIVGCFVTWLNVVHPNWISILWNTGAERRAWIYENILSPTFSFIFSGDFLGPVFILALVVSFFWLSARLGEWLSKH